MTFTTRPELRGTFGMVASTHWLASAAGMAVLERGGNAFDAAVATGLTLQVVEPHLNGPGGDLPVVLWSAEQGRPLVLCAQGVAPAAATIERYRELGHDLVPGTGLLAACVPGAFDGWMLLLREFGTMRLADVFEVAIGYAEDGYPVVPGITATIRAAEPLLRDWPGSAELYLPAPQPGELFRNRQLAATYGRIVAESLGGDREAEIERARDVFYRGFVAEAIDAFCREHGGPARRRRPRLVERDARAAGDVRVPRAHGLQDRPVGPGPGAAPAARAARRLRPRGPVAGGARPHRRRVHEARVRRSGGVLRRPGLRRRPARAASLRRRTPTSAGS